MTRRQGRLLLAAGAVLLASPLLLATPSSAEGAVCSEFSAAGTANGVRSGFASPGYLVVEGASAGGPTAQVGLDAQGTAIGYAAYPDPGDEVNSSIPLVTSQTGAPAPSNPLTVVSQYPTTPEKTVSTPAASPTARTTARSAVADARSGADASESGSAGRVSASASASCNESGEVAVRSESVVENLNLAGVLRIGSLHSVATVKVRPGEKPVVESELEITGATVAGQTVGLTPDGLVIGSTPAPLGGNPLTEVLKGAGIEVNYLESVAQPDGNGVVAPGVHISLTREVTGAAPTTVFLTLGRSYAAAAAGPGAASGDVPVAETFDSGGTASVDTGSAEVDGAAMGSLPSGGGGNAPAATAGGRQALRTIAGTVPVTFSTWSIYAVLVVAALMLLSSSVLFKKLGVKLGWS